MDAAREREYIEALQHVLQAGQCILAEGGSALDAVTEAVRLLEECPLFNAGKGAVLTHAGTYELDAAVMDGATLEAGAVACVTRLRNPVLAARACWTTANTCSLPARREACAVAGAGTGEPGLLLHAGPP